MEMSSIKKWIVFFAGILCAILIADACSTYVANAAGIAGPTRLIVSFILYAGIFFAILYALEKMFSIEFFGFRNR
jgi:hypothetical protein